MRFDSSKLLDGLTCLTTAITDKAAREPPKTLTIPRFEPGDQPSFFRLVEETRLFWAAIVDDAYPLVADDDRVVGAVTEIAHALPAEVRDTQYGWLGPVGSAAACAFRAFCEIALSESAPTIESVAANTGEAIDALDTFLVADRHRLVQTAPIFGVKLPQDVGVARNVVLRAVDDHGRQDIWRRIGTTVGPRSAGVAFMSPTVHEVANVHALVEIERDLPRDTPTPPWRELQDPIEPTVEALRLTGPGPVRSLGQWTAFPEHEPFLRRLFPTGTTRAGQSPRHSIDEPPLVLTNGDRLRELYTWHAAAPRWPANERQVYDVAHRRFAQTYQRVHDEDRLIDAWIAFEALFLPKQEGELSYRAQMRIARFVGRDLPERELIRAQLRNSYTMRSNVVHGTHPSKRKPEQVASRTNETLALLRRALCLWLDPRAARSDEALDRALLS